MARIVRNTQFVFASSATDNGQFGSAQAGTFNVTNNVATIQALSAWATGWLAATIGANDFPPLEEIQAIDYVITSQIAYLFQEGIPEWDAGTTYFDFSIVKAPGTFTYFGSLINTNLNQALPAAGASNASWQCLGGLSPTFLSVETAIPASNTAVNFAHGLGVVPASYKIRLRCKITELGYSVGDEVQLSSNSDGDAAHASGTWANATNIGYINSQATPLVYNRTSNVMAAVTAANWKLVCSAGVN